MKVLQKLKKFQISRENLKHINGGEDAVFAGAGQSYRCSCSSHAGTWTGNYGTQAKADESLKTWCADGKGSCDPV